MKDGTGGSVLPLSLVLRSLLVPLQTPGSFLPAALPFPLQAREALESISLRISCGILPIHPTQASQTHTPPGEPIAHPKTTLRGAWEPSSTLCASALVGHRGQESGSPMGAQFGVKVAQVAASWSQAAGLSVARSGAVPGARSPVALLLPSGATRCCLHFLGRKN